MTAVQAIDLRTRQRALADLLTNTGYYAQRVTTIISDEPLPECEFCAYRPASEANCELFHDQGSVLSCRCCLIDAAARAIEVSEHGEFWIEITERPSRGYLVEPKLTDLYGAFVRRDDGDWSRYYCAIDLDAVSDGAA